MAVAALEGAHAAFLSDVFTDKLPGGNNDTNRKIIAEYLRLLGMSGCNKLTPYLFMEKDEQPEAKTIKMAGKGLTYRNEIMHELRNMSDYKHRLRTNEDISEAYSAVLMVYECYRIEVEKRNKE